MKLLIFLALMTSCGKHSQPKAIDINDHDGDHQIEGGYFSKYIANYEALDRVSGQIEFTATTLQMAKFSNHVDLQAEAMKLLIGDKKAIQKDDYFLEGTELQLENKLDKNLPLLDLTLVNIQFDETNSEPTELLLVKGKSVKTLGSWRRSMAFQLDKRSLNSLLAGESKLVVKKKPVKEKFFNETTAESIREKTRKVYVHDGKTTKILYISKDLPEVRIHEFLNVEKPQEVTDENLFFNSLSMGEPEWFKRTLSNGHQVFFYGTIQQLKLNFLKKFEVQKFTLSRINGLNSNEIELHNPMDSNVYLKIRGLKADNIFKQVSEKRRHTGKEPNYISYSCHYQVMKLTGTAASATNFEDFYGNVLDIENFHNDLKFIEQTDEKGVYWEVKFLSSKLNYKLSLLNRPDPTFVMIGDIGHDCLWMGFPQPTQKINREAKIEFEIESFVEKI
jgi:hypothetical protein